MADKWKTLPLEDCMAAIIDYRGKSPEKTTFGVPLVTAKIVKGGRIEKPEEFIAEADFDDWMRRGMPKPGDIVMTTEAPLGEVAQLDGRKVALAQRVITLRGKPDVLDNTFLKFLLHSNPVQEELRSRGTGTTVVGIRQSELRKISLTLPPLAEQKAIAAVLGTLDDKIELNRRMNVTLEAMARALFQSWFVDFDPVRAKLDGRQPVGMDEATAALFPDSFQSSEAGHIPKGWTIRPLSSLTRYLSRGIGPSYLERGGVCVLNQKCVREHRVDFSKSRRHDAAKKPINDRALAIHDILVNSTGMGTLGRVAQMLDLPEVTIVDSHVTIVRAAADTDPFFLGINLTGREAEIEELGEGSTGQTELSRTRLGALKIVTPPLDLQKAFGTAVSPLLMRISNNENQSRTLATLRDTLLPKLLSGELSATSLRYED
jgi:type I restriction enzyme S subunit